jgi:hypothetical protein
MEIAMPQTRDWKETRSLSARLLMERSGADVDAWNRRIKSQRFKDEQSLRTWLAERGVAGSAQSLLVMEQFGYPDFLLASAEEFTMVSSNSFCPVSHRYLKLSWPTTGGGRRSRPTQSTNIKYL